MNPPLVENKQTLTWNSSHDCVFEAILINNQIAELRFCEPPAKSGGEQICMHSTNENYLRQAHACLGELLSYIDKQRSLTGTFRMDEIVEMGLVGE